MSPEDEQFNSDARDEFVPAVVARSTEEAEEYRELLNDHDIPAVVGEIEVDDPDEEHRLARGRGMGRGVPVLVPEAMLDEASEIIADREDDDEFRTDEEEVEEEDDEEFGYPEEIDTELDDELEDEEEEELLLDDEEDDEDVFPYDDGDEDDEEL